MNDLYEVTEGASGLIYWFEKTNREVSEEDAFKIRQKAISDSINAAIQNAVYNGNRGDVHLAMQKGWNSANQQVEMMENGNTLKSMAVMIGIPNLIDLISEIEISVDFRGWTNPFLIDQIKQYYQLINQ